jgi:hypothetical protein
MEKAEGLTEVQTIHALQDLGITREAITTAMEDLHRDRVAHVAGLRITRHLAMYTIEDEPRMIHLEILEADGSQAIANDWREGESRQMAAYRMRWLKRSGRWARTTDHDGRVQTFGQVPENMEAPAGHYEARKVAGDELVKVFTPKTTRSRAEQWRLDNRMGINGELVLRWVVDQDEPQPERPCFERGDQVRNRYTFRPAQVLEVRYNAGDSTWYLVVEYDNGIALSGVVGAFEKITPSDAEAKRYGAGQGWTLDQAREAMRKVGDELEANAANLARALDEAGAPGLRVTFDRTAKRFDATRDGEVVAFAKWHGEHPCVFLPGGTFVGRLYRSEGRIIAGRPSTPTARTPEGTRSGTTPGSARWPGARRWRTPSRHC